MKVTGDAVLHAPVEKVWDALLDPEVLVRTIPGCERLEASGEHSYAMTVTAGVAAIKGTYAGSCDLTDLVRHDSLVMKLDGAGAPGTIGATVRVGFADEGEGTTRLTYDADAVVGGMVGGVGQRMLTSVSRRMAGEFFGNVDGVLTGASGTDEAPGEPGEQATRETAKTGRVFSAPAKPAGGRPQEGFLAGVAVGAGLVLAGVIVGGIFGRRR